MRLLLIHADAAARFVLASRVRALPGVEMIGEAADGKFAVALAQAMRPDVVLMALDMPIMDGITATRMLSTDNPSTLRIVGICNTDHNAAKVQAMLDAGAIACVRTAAALDALLTVLVRVHGKTP